MEVHSSDQQSGVFHDDLVELVCASLDSELAARLRAVHAHHIDADSSPHRVGCGEVDHLPMRPGEYLVWEHSLAHELVRGYDRWSCCVDELLEEARRQAGGVISAAQRSYRLRTTLEYWRETQDHASYTCEVIARLQELQGAVEVRGAAGRLTRAELERARMAAWAAVVECGRSGELAQVLARTAPAAVAVLERACSRALAGEVGGRDCDVWIAPTRCHPAATLAVSLGETVAGGGRLGSIASVPAALAEALGDGICERDGVVVLSERVRDEEEGRLALALLPLDSASALAPGYVPSREVIDAAISSARDSLALLSV